MSNYRPYQVKPHHLDRNAVVYLRQSTMLQVEEHTGSTAYQYAQADHARRWGWLEERIVVIDEDLGLSGTSTAHRTGWQTLLRLVGEDKVGIILFSETSRLNRNSRDYDMLLRLCEEFDVLLAADGHVLDPKEPNDFTMGLLQAIFAQHENRTRIANLRRARQAKARQGIPVSPPPVGYVVAADRRWIKEPDERVREMIPFLYHEYVRLGSLGRVVKELRRSGMQLPGYRGGRLRGREILWRPPSVGRLYHLLTNPAYCGDYVYRPGTGTRPGSGSGGKPRAIPKAVPETWSWNRDNHERYIPRHLWDDVQARLAANHRGWRQPAGKGDALLQGVAVCDDCNHQMLTGYNRQGIYRCSVGANYGIQTCGSVAAHLVDPMVVARLCRRLQAPKSEDLLAVLERAAETHAAIEQMQAREIAHAEYQVQLAERRYKAEDPENRLVVATLAREWDAALRQVEVLRQQHAENPSRPPTSLTAEEKAEFLAMAALVPTVWSAPTTTTRERKILLRCFIRKVRLGGLKTEKVSIAIEWLDGTVTRARALKARGVWQLIGQMRDANMSYQAIADELNRQGLRPRSRRPFTAASVMKTFNRSVKPPPHTLSFAAVASTLRELVAQRLTNAQIADRFNALGRRTPRYRPWRAGSVWRALKHLGISKVG